MASFDFSKNSAPKRQQRHDRVRITAHATRHTPRNFFERDFAAARHSVMTPSRVLAAIALVSALAVAEAHPDLYGSVHCTADQHPTGRSLGHGATSPDASIGFTLAWAAPDGGDAAQSNENDPDRAIPEAWEIATAEYKPGARHTLTVVNPNVGEMMVTCSHGVFEEFGRRLDGSVNYGLGAARCDGKRYDATFKKPNTRFVWNAPDEAEAMTNVTRVVFKVTTASGRNGAFRNNQATFAANAGLPPPPPGAPSGLPRPRPAGGSGSTNGGGTSPGFSSKLVRALGPRMCRAAASYARAASSAVSNVPSHRRAPRLGSRISAAQLVQVVGFVGFGFWVWVSGFGASRAGGRRGQREREVPRDEKTRIFAALADGEKNAELGAFRFVCSTRFREEAPENAQEKATQKISLVRDEKSGARFFVLFRGERRGRGGSRTFPTVVGGRLGKSRRWSSWTWSWPWPASRGRSGGFSACPRRGRGSEKARGESPFRGSGLRPVTLARTKSFRKNARRKPSEARVPSEKNARRADG